LLENLRIASLRAAYQQGRLTPDELVETVLQRVEHYPDPAVWISRVPEDAVRKRAAALLALGPADLPLYGIPFAVKDNMDVAGMPTTAACPAFAYTPERTATLAQRLLDAGAILIGRTNLDQVTTGLVGTRSPYGAPRCVFDPHYVSGESSSGSAVAVAAGLVAFALGTDTAGSGRVPAAFNDLVGIKSSAVLPHGCRGRRGASFRHAAQPRTARAWRHAAAADPNRVRLPALRAGGNCAGETGPGEGRGGDRAGIEIEIWDLDEAGLGRFVSGISAPLGIGKVVLMDGAEV